MDIKKNYYFKATSDIHDNVTDIYEQLCEEESPEQREKVTKSIDFLIKELKDLKEIINGKKSK